MTTASEVKKDMRDTLKKAGKAVESNTHNLRDVAEEVGKNTRQFLNEKSEQAVEFQKTAEEKIAAHPLRSVAIAAAGGLLLGMILRR